MDLEFNNTEELFNRLKPALVSKQKELIRTGYRYIEIEDIWNYLKEKIWVKANDLSLSAMVHDIFNADNALIDEYLKLQLSRKNRNMYFDMEDVK